MSLLPKTNEYSEVIKCDDLSFTIIQTYFSLQLSENKTLKFGPLTTTLAELFEKGFWLEVSGFTFQRKFSLLLTNGLERYRLRTLVGNQLSEKDDLSQWIREGQTVEMRPVPLKEYVVLVRKIKEEIVKDPLEELMQQYPFKKKSVEMIGNQSIGEFVKHQLKQMQRKLDYVE